MQWNPSITSNNCSGFQSGNFYCVNWPWTPEFNGTDYSSNDYSDWPFPQSSCDNSTANITVSPTTTMTAAPTPSGVLPNGTLSNCKKYYTVQSGDSCAAIESTFSITFAQLYAWNPSIGSNCEFLDVGVIYCVAAPATSTTSVSLPNPTTTAVPQPLQSGVVANCNKYYQIVSDDNCAKIEAEYGITDTQFKNWNQGLNSQCTNLFLSYWCCVGVSI